MGLFTKLFGTPSQREIKKIRPLMEKVLALEEAYKELSDEDLKAKTRQFKNRLAQGETLDDLLPEAFATARASHLLCKEVRMSEEKILTYKGHPLMRKDNLIYYGSMADSHIIMLQVLESKKQGEMDIATRVSVQLQLTDPTAKSRDRSVKKSEKPGLYAALDVGCVWLERALAGK